MPYFILLLFCQLSLYAAPAGIQNEWSAISHPLIMSSTFERRFYALPLRGKVKKGSTMWSGDYWALNKGNIDFRWNASATLRNRPAPSKEEAMKMSLEELAKLSPAEKFDLLNAQYHYPLKAEVRKMASPHAQNWEGICHGWAPASMNHNGPTPKVLKGADGLNIPFGSSDIKALLSYYYAVAYHTENTYQVGRRCSSGQHCKEDLNAGAFHIVLANKVGRENSGFIADMDRWQEVWNHPVVSYETKVVSQKSGKNPGAAPGTVRTLRVRTVLHFVDEDKNSWEPTTPKMDQKSFEYELELNAQGMIIGGGWKHSARPDFLWLKEKPAYFEGAFYQLGDLLND